MTESLTAAACRVLMTARAEDKAAASRTASQNWLSGKIPAGGVIAPPERPARPTKPELRPPRDMPKRRRAGSRSGRIALLHALAHIELNAIDLAWDMVARFAGEDLPKAFYDDWVRIAGEEAEHFELLAERLAEFGATYGDLPAHDGLWQAAEETAHDLLARLAVVPLVLEARGLDVTPAMILRLEAAGDIKSANILQRIYRDEIGHVAAGRHWFEHIARERGLESRSAWQNLVRRHFGGVLKPPFNIKARNEAGLPASYYEPLAEGEAPASP